MSERIEWIDTVRGILMGLVILGHALAETSYHSRFYHGYILLFRWISVFHMPAFFILSGMLFNKEKWKDKTLLSYVKRKAVSLLIPYIVFEGAAIILQVYILKNIDFKNAIINTLKGNSNLGADWFLYVLFIATIILFFISKIDNRLIHIFAATLFIIMASFCNGEIHFQLVAGRCLIASSFIIIGYCFKNVLAVKIKSVFIACFFILTLIIAVINGPVGMYQIEMHNVFLFVAGAICGTIVILNISMRVSSRLLAKAGRNSLVIMGTHQHIIYIVRKVGLPIIGFIPTMCLFFCMILYSNLLATGWNVIRKGF